MNELQEILDGVRSNVRYSAVGFSVCFVVVMAATWAGVHWLVLVVWGLCSVCFGFTWIASMRQVPRLMSLIAAREALERGDLAAATKLLEAS